MLVGANGRLAGTVGGGAVEYRCITTAQELLGGETVLKDYCLNQGDQTGLGMICGGDVQVHFLPVAAHDPGVLALCREAADHFRDGTPFWLVTPLQPGEIPMLWMGTGDTRTLPFTPAQALSPDPKIYEADGKRWFTEELQSPGRVYIFGGGHVAQALVPILASVDFSCVVLENREEFSDPSLFPQASRVC
jgi:xanthine dehydrogenase accessory factor